MRRGLILVEGQTEEVFVRQVLQPHLHSVAALWLEPTLAVTKRVKSGPNFKGGILSFAQVERDLSLLLRDTNVEVVTCMLDYYRLPSDFPGMADRPAGSPRQRVQHVERKLFDRTGDRRFRPFLALHELEAWLFSDLDASAWAFPPGSDLQALKVARLAVASPEDINESYATAPSRRVAAACPGYQKPLHGPFALEAIGLPAIRAQCPHFNDWLVGLEQQPTQVATRT